MDCMVKILASNFQGFCTQLNSYKRFKNSFTIVRAGTCALDLCVAQSKGRDLASSHQAPTF